MPVRKYYLWYKAPFLRLLPPLIAGIILYLFLPFANLPVFFIIIILSLSALISFGFLPLKLRFRLRWLPALLIAVLLIMLGYGLAYQKDITNNNRWIGRQHYLQQDAIIAALKDAPIAKEKTVKSIAELKYLVINHKLKSIKGEAILYFPKPTIKKLTAGSQIMISASALEKIPQPKNPAAFNYAGYCHHQQIYYQAFLQNSDWRLITNKPSLFQKLINKSRIWCANNINHYITEPKANAIARALLLGQREDIDPQLRQDYINAGVVHLIAISGLHLGIIYILLSFLLRWLPAKNKINIIRALVIIGCLWFFALLTGGRASVMRAALMFSLIEAGRSFFKRKIDIYNSLAAAAFLLLCINPYQLTKVGFQLSFAAVLSIVIFQPLFASLYYSRYKIVSFFWEILCASLAAQILTFPITIYYFHQFPLFFLFANMIAIPLVIIIVYAEVLLLILSFMPIIAHYIGIAATFLIHCLNAFIADIANAPFALWDHLFLSMLQIILIYLLIIALFHFIIKQNKRALLYSLGLCGVFSLMLLIHYIKIHRHQKLVIYDIPRHQAVDIINGKKTVFIGDSDLTTDNYILSNAREYYHISQQAKHFNNLYLKKSFIDYDNNRLVIIYQAVEKQQPSHPIKTDLLLISHNPNISISTLLSYFSPSEIIFDASNPPWKIEKWKSECNRLNLPCFSVPEQGAFIYQL